MSSKEQRDSIDFGTMRIPKLFIKIFIPTFFGLLSGAVLNLADGVFVGRGVGSDALAAINITAPMYLICTGLALMFGSGVSIVASIHLSRNNKKAADINVTQAFFYSSLMMIAVIAVILIFPEQVCRLLGGSERLAPYVRDYFYTAGPGLLGLMILFEGLFILRVDGAPKLAMMAEVSCSCLNIVLDYIFVFPLQMGIAGAGLATTISEFIGASVVLIYLARYSKQINFYPLKFSRTSLKLSFRNLRYMVKLGLPSFIGEFGMSVVIIVGNYMFMKNLNEDGVAAYGIVCYLLPLIFMFANALSQSALPIISYNHGLGDRMRVRKTLNFTLSASVILGVLISAFGFFFAKDLVSLFLDSSAPAWRIAVEGLPIFSLGILFFTLNIVMIGYEQSIEQAKPAISFMLMRGLIFVVPCFLILPEIIGDRGLWLSVPAAETLTSIAIILYFIIRRIRLQKQ